MCRTILLSSCHPLWFSVYIGRHAFLATVHESPSFASIHSSVPSGRQRFILPASVCFCPPAHQEEIEKLKQQLEQAFQGPSHPAGGGGSLPPNAGNSSGPSPGGVVCLEVPPVAPVGVDADDTTLATPLGEGGGVSGDEKTPPSGAAATTAAPSDQENQKDATGAGPEDGLDEENTTAAIAAGTTVAVAAAADSNRGGVVGAEVEGEQPTSSAAASPEVVFQEKIVERVVVEEKVGRERGIPGT